MTDFVLEKKNDTQEQNDLYRTAILQGSLVCNKGALVMSEQSHNLSHANYSIGFTGACAGHLVT